MATMRAVAVAALGPLAPGSMVDVEIARPDAPSGYDVVVRVEAVSLNPLDTKYRAVCRPQPQRVA